mgnify:CR=1 FL=1
MEYWVFSGYSFMSLNVPSKFFESLKLIWIIIKYKTGIVYIVDDERADPNSVKWENHPWQRVFEKRKNYAVDHAIQKKCLDMCCGIGWTSYAISKVADSVVGIDYSEEAIEEAKSNYQSPNLKFKNMNALDLEFPPEVFDLVVSMEAIEHFTKENGLLFLDQVKRVLKKDGLFIGSTPEVENRSILKLYSLQLQDPFHLFLYSKSILKKTLSKYFTHVEVYSQPEDWLLFKCKK